MSSQISILDKHEPIEPVITIENGRLSRNYFLDKPSERREFLSECREIFSEGKRN